MRPIDADEVRKHAIEVYHCNGVELETIMVVPLSAIDKAQTIPLPDFKDGYKQAILDGKTNYSRSESKIVPDAKDGWRYEE